MEAKIPTPPAEILGAKVSNRNHDDTTGGSMSKIPLSSRTSRRALEDELIEYFISFVQIFGLPKSIGQIYGLLFATPTSRTMSEIIERLGISKGSASQGLTLLRRLGAVTSSVEVAGRREQYQADLNVSRIVRHFFDHQLRPRLENSEDRLMHMLDLVNVDQVETDQSEESLTLLTRLEALQKWQRRGKSVLPMIARWLLP